MALTTSVRSEVLNFYGDAHVFEMSISASSAPIPDFGQTSSRLSIDAFAWLLARPLLRRRCAQGFGRGRDAGALILDLGRERLGIAGAQQLPRCGKPRADILVGCDLQDVG